MRPHPLWIYARQIARWKSLNADAPTRALVVDLDDPVLAPLMQLAPTQRDLSDERGALAGPRKYFLRRRALLRKLVALRMGCLPEQVVVTHDAQGAPRVVSPDPAVFVSVSAQGSYAALAISDTPVGIDIELHRRRAEPVWDVLHRSERGEVEAEWRGEGDDSLFRNIWIAKEAYLKALGVGLKRDPASVAVHFSGFEVFEIRDDSRPHAVFQGLHASKVIGEQLLACACIALDGRPIRTVLD